ncbi:MAG: ABC transporter ATP-binding protein [Oceanospirillaceae bacterium]|nr:ABC transporter ATP-binding protein [Oceanospirillaceae bacterium]
MTDVLVDAQGISKSYRNGLETVTVLRDLSLQLKAGETVAVVGPSGCGKSTLLHLLNGLLQPDAGHLCLFGRRVAGEDDWAALRRSRIATLFQDGNLIPTLTVGGNLAFRAHLAGRVGDSAAALLQALDIAAIAGRYPDQLSGGQRQRAALACAFAIGPDLVLADEPTGSLDEATAQRVMPLFFDTMRTRGPGALIVTHNPDLARRCDRVLRLHDGSLVPWA